ncbi:hypothetical protein [Microbulbifer magnicolonia]|uniref:hypothetical protein n=1 Tax=Microbulbifer magnicolonia TaxID=3109744 RepID=UPI002B411394|nr:hypothetical protein [Microbulbifer sp. GG15]
MTDAMPADLVAAVAREPDWLRWWFRANVAANLAANLAAIISCLVFVGTSLIVDTSDRIRSLRGDHQPLFLN